MALAGWWHLSLFVIHVICFVVIFFTATDLKLKELSIYSVQQVLYAARSDPNAMLVDRELRDGDGEAEKALANVRSCLIVCAVIGFIIVFMILVNIYCFLAVILSPDSTAMTTLPGLAAIRSKMEEEVQGAELPAEGQAPPPAAGSAEAGLATAESGQSEKQAGGESAAPESAAPDTGESAAGGTESETNA